VLELLEKRGKGLNLTMQVLDGILCHNGEEDYKKSTPQFRKSFADFDEVYNSIKANSHISYLPATLEGCLVKICDTISYVGRDLEDAIILKLIRRDDLPTEVVVVLGDTAGKIVYTLVTDVIRESKDQPFIAFSERVAEEHAKLKKMMGMVFETFLEDLEKERLNSSIYKDFLDELDESYLKNNEKERIVIDYIASMTDRYFLDVLKEKFLIHPLPRYFS
jgi:dGTPase